MFVKNPTPPLAPAPVPTLNDAIAHPPANSTLMHTQTSTSYLSGTVSFTQAQRDRYPTEEKVLEESERIAEKSLTRSGSLTNETAGAVNEQSQLVLSVGSDRSYSFSEPQNSESGSSGGGRVSIGIAGEPTDVSAPKPVDELPADVLKVEGPKSVEHTVAIVNGRDSAQPEDRAINVTQESDTRVSLPALTTQPSPSIPGVAGQSGCVDQPSEEGAIDTCSESKGGDGRLKEEKELKVGNIEDVKDGAEPVLLPSTSLTPRVKEGSQGTNADESNAHLVAEDQPDPAKRAEKHADSSTISFIPVRHFCRAGRSVLCRFGCADQSCPMFVKNLTLPLAPASVPTLNDAMAHPPTDFTPTHIRTSTSDSPRTVSLTRAQRDRSPTEERVPEESERAAEKSPTGYGSLTDEATCAIEEQSQLMMFVGTDSSDSFPAPHNSESGPGSGGRDLIGIVDESADVFHLLKSAGELPENVSNAGQPQNSEHAGAAEDDRHSTKPEDLAMHATQELDTCVSLPALTTQPSPSIPEVARQDDSAGFLYPTMERVLEDPIAENSSANSGSLTGNDTPAGTVHQEGQHVAFMSGYWSDSFAAPQKNLPSMLGGGEKVLIEIGKESTDAFSPLKSLLGGINVAIEQIDVRFPDLCSCSMYLTILS